jgi:hypothetical protein
MLQVTTRYVKLVLHNVHINSIYYKEISNAVTIIFRQYL